MTKKIIKTKTTKKNYNKNKGNVHIKSDISTKSINKKSNGVLKHHQPYIMPSISSQQQPQQQSSNNDHLYEL